MCDIKISLMDFRNETKIYTTTNNNNNKLTVYSAFSITEDRLEVSSKLKIRDSAM